MSIFMYPVRQDVFRHDEGANCFNSVHPMIVHPVRSIIFTLLLLTPMLNREKWIPHISCKRHLGWACFLVQMGKYCIMKIVEAALLSTSLHLPLLQLHQILTVQIQCLSTLFQNRQKLQVRSIAHLTILLLLLL